MNLLSALRALARSPGFAGVSILTFALAIAAIGTLYAVVNAVLLRPLPFPDSERIVRIIRSQGSCTDCPIARLVLFDWQQQASASFETMGAFHGADATLTGDGDAENLAAYKVTPEFWSVLAVRPLVGRTFDATEDREHRAVVVISHGLWQRRYAGNRDVVGRSMLLNGIAHEIIGVMPEYFRYPGGDVWLPAQLADATTGRDSNYLSVVARLRPGATLDGARAILASITAREAADHPTEHEGLTARMMPLQERVTSAVRPALTALFAAACLVLLIACANLANLMLARSQERGRELAVRAALGSGRGRLLRMLAAEAVLIALAGTALGLALTALALHLLPTLAPDLLPAYNPLAIDARVIAFVVAVAVAAVFGFGLLPAWRPARADPATALRDEARAGAGGRASARMRSLLIIVEVALSLVLLVGAALLIESSRRLAEVDPVIAVDRLLTAGIQLPTTANVPGENATGWSARHRAATLPRIDTLLETLRALPGVESVALTDALPLSGRGNTNSTIKIVGRDYPGGEQAMPLTEWRFVSSDYFRTVGLPVLKGRAFAPEDAHGPAPSSLILVNDAYVRTFLADVDPLGQQLIINGDEPKTIVGVVASARQWGLEQAPSPEVYLPIYDSFVTHLGIVVRTRGAPELGVEPLRRTLREAVPDLPVEAVRTMAQLIHDGSSFRRFFTLLMIGFSGVALLLAAVGLYGLIAYSVARRRVEIGVRMSLGADRRGVLLLILRQGLRLVAIGLVIGTAGVLALTGLLDSFLYGVAPRDPLVIAAVALFLLAVGVLASIAPALRAARLRPVEALRPS